MADQHADPVRRPWFGQNTVTTIATFDKTKVRIVCWEYSANGWDGPHTCREMPTHAVAWMRPKFEMGAQDDG